MTDLVLYGCPNTCALISHVALEAVGVSFTYEFVNLHKGEHRGDGYLAVNPRGKVPTLRADGKRLTETIAILHWLSTAFPAAALLPATSDVDMLSDLGWFASGVHPVMARMLVPSRMVEGESCQSSLQASAVRTLAAEFALIDERLAGRAWWLDGWSGLDAYLFWIWARSSDGPIDFAAYPNYARHARAMMALPAVQRALDRERGYMACYPNLAASVATA